jgi:hypothetical protein
MDDTRVTVDLSGFSVEQWDAFQVLLEFEDLIVDEPAKSVTFNVGYFNAEMLNKTCVFLQTEMMRQYNIGRETGNFTSMIAFEQSLNPTFDIISKLLKTRM